MSAKMNKNFALLFDRPSEPLVLPKGNDGVIINLQEPPPSQPDYSIVNRFNTGPDEPKAIEIPAISLPDFSIPLKLKHDVEFTTFNPLHQEYAKRCIEIFMAVRLQDLFYVASSIRDSLHPELFNYSLRIALEHRKDTKDIAFPSLLETFPQKFFSSSTIDQGKREANLKRPGSRIALEIPYDYTATDEDPEYRLAYFREDVGINLHHWHWHLIYPFAGPEHVVRKDRRGELFYYMHQQLLARYNCERFCNKLNPTVPYDVDDFNKPIPEAYFPKLDQTVAGRAWPARPENMILSNANRKADGFSVNLADCKLYKSRIEEAIKSHRVRDKNGKEIILDEQTGIDILGNMIEASPVLSPNIDFYGGLHNYGHISLAVIHDPHLRYLEPLSVMGSPATAMRDPMFYRWHTAIENIFKAYKRSLPPYTKDQLIFDFSLNLQVLQVSINSPKSNPNTINTHWSKSDIDINYGLDFTPRGAVLVRVQHLDHVAFEYKISVENPGPADVTGTVRIFMAPKTLSNGLPINLDQQRSLMIEMDKFTHTIKKGKSEIKRKSTESTLTIPFEATFRDQRPRPEAMDIDKSKAFDFCGCGWPQHMLVPKGTENGFPMDLFVMISDYNKDKKNPDGCRTGVSFCGLRDRKYPDVRAMGYPFDRPTSAGSLQQFLTPNMKVQPITIRFSNKVKPRQTSK